MEWLFDGLGTMLLGLLFGGTGGSLVMYRIMKKKCIQKQKGGHHSTLYQAGRDIVNTRDPEEANTESS